MQLPTTAMLRDAGMVLSFEYTLASILYVERQSSESSRLRSLCSIGKAREASTSASPFSVRIRATSVIDDDLRAQYQATDFVQAPMVDPKVQKG